MVCVRRKVLLRSLVCYIIKVFSVILSDVDVILRFDESICNAFVTFFFIGFAVICQRCCFAVIFECDLWHATVVCISFRFEE